MIKIFGNATLKHRVVTRTLDNYGQVSSTATSDTTFRGDLQFGMDLDSKYLSTGRVEVGDAVLYLHPTELATLPLPRDQIVDGNAIWEIVSQLESAELGGSVTHYTYRCKRRINSSDV